MKNITFLLISFFLTSCLGSRKILTSLNKSNAPLEYLHDSKINKCAKSTNLTIVKFDNYVFDSATSVSKINHLVLPLLIYYHEKIDLAVKLGQSSLKQNYSDFFKKSFATECQRTGCFFLIDNPVESKYLVEITYDKCEISSEYERKRSVFLLPFVYSIKNEETAYPAEADLALIVKLREGSAVIFEKRYSVKKTQPFIYTEIMDLRKIRSDFATNMAESLSLGTKVCIEQIIADINQVINK